MGLPPLFLAAAYTAPNRSLINCLTIADAEDPEDDGCQCTVNLRVLIAAICHQGILGVKDDITYHQIEHENGVDQQVLPLLELVLQFLLPSNLLAYPSILEIGLICNAYHLAVPNKRKGILKKIHYQIC